MRSSVYVLSHIRPLVLAYSVYALSHGYTARIRARSRMRSRMRSLTLPRSPEQESIYAGECVYELYTRFRERDWRLLERYVTYTHTHIHYVTCTHTLRHIHTCTTSHTHMHYVISRAREERISPTENLPNRESPHCPCRCQRRYST